MGFLTSTPSPDRTKLLDLLGTRVVLVDGRRRLRPPGLDEFLARLRIAGRCEIAGSGIPVDLYVNSRALPRAFVVHRVVGAADPEQTLRLLTARHFDPRREAIVEGNPSPLASDGIGTGGRVEIASYEPGRVVVRVDSTSPGLLVLTDSYDPEWKVTRNGEDARIHPTNALFRGVFVPAGRSELIFRYRPRRFQLGAAISSVTAIFGGLLWFRTRSRFE